jgi:hypothetical protein
MDPINLQKVDQAPTPNSLEMARSRITNEQLQNFITFLSSVDLNLPEDKQVSDIRAFNIRVAPNNNGGMINVVFK